MQTSACNDMLVEGIAPSADDHLASQPCSTGMLSRTSDGNHARDCQAPYQWSSDLVLGRMQFSLDKCWVLAALKIVRLQLVCVSAGLPKESS